MTLKNAINFFDTLKLKATKKSEIKIYEKFHHILNELNNREFSTEEMQCLESELDRLNIKSNPENRKKFFRKALAQFEKYLKDSFSLTTDGYYTNLSVSVGILVGVFLGVLLGERFEKSSGLSFGICIGLFIGAFIGRRMDAQAKAAGNML